MAIIYKYSKYKDVHTILNSNLFNIEYTIKKVSCEATSVIATGVIPFEQVLTIPFQMDGKYQITLRTLVGEPEEVLLPLIDYYNTLLVSFISTVQGVICGCKECKECNTCEDYISSFTKAFAFSSLNQSMYKLYMDAIVTNSVCSFDDVLLGTMMKERLYGDTDFKKVMLRLLSYYYYAFYFKDKFTAKDAAEKEYVATKYKFSTISKCIRQLGIDPTTVIAELESTSKVHYWQLSSLTDNITSVTSIISPEYLDSKLSTAYTNFEAGKTIPYNLTGRLVFVVTNTGTTDFEIRDSMNNDITDEFDVSYNSTYSYIVLVSKNVYVEGSVYFKFKKLV